MGDGPDLLLFHGLGSLGSQGEGKCSATVDVGMLLLISYKHIARVTSMVGLDSFVIYCDQLRHAVIGRRGIIAGLFQHWGYLRVLM